MLVITKRTRRPRRKPPHPPVLPLRLLLLLHCFTSISLLFFILVVFGFFFLLAFFFLVAFTPIHVGSTIFGGWSFRTTSATSASEKVISGCT